MNRERPGFDAPSAVDLLDRWPIAKAVESVVGSAPAGYSVRVGVYGAWGTGKTSVLRYVRQLAESKGHVVAQFSPWGHTDGRSMWLALASALVEALTTAGLSVKGRWKTSRVFQKSLGAGKQLLNLRNEAKAVGAAVEPLLAEFLAFTTDDLRAATASLGENRRLIILVDDLDRADPKLVPHVLFALREVLDHPGLSWALAMDPDIVSKTLAAYHPGFSPDQGDYLEKIAEYRFWLPDASAEQAWRVVEQDLKKEVSVAIDTNLLRQELPFLPRNPRALRAFLRHLAILTPEIGRYSKEDLDYRLLVLVTLLNVEFPKLCTFLLTADDLLKELSMSFLHNEDRDPNSEKRKALLDRLTKAVNAHVIEGEREIAIRLLQRLGDHTLWIDEYFRQYAHILDRPPVLTRKEFLQVFDLPDTPTLRAWADTWANERRCQPGDVMRAIFDRAMELHDAFMSRAADALTEDEMGAEAARCARVLLLVEKVSFELDGFTGNSPTLTSKNLASLLTAASRWAHFRNTPQYEALRSTERRLLLRLCSEASVEPNDLLTALAPWDADRFDVGSDAPFRTELRLELTQIVERRAAERAVSRFLEPSAIGATFAIAEEAAVRWVVFRASSPLWSAPLRQQVRDILSKDEPAIAENALDFMRRISDGKHLREVASGRIEPLAKDKELVEWFWSACTRRRPNIRRASDIRALKRTFDQKFGHSLVEPPWWTEFQLRLKELGVVDKE
jgi:hypothetical protein